MKKKFEKSPIPRVGNRVLFAEDRRLAGKEGSSTYKPGDSVSHAGTEWSVAKTKNDGKLDLYNYPVLILDVDSDEVSRIDHAPRSIEGTV